MWGKFVYREVAPTDKMVFVNSFSDENGGTVRAPFSTEWPLEVLSTLNFVRHEHKTTLEMHAVPINASESENATFAAMRDSLSQGWNGTLDQLADYLSDARNLA